jgi:hypothetical protein
MENTDIILQTCENISNELTCVKNSVVENITGGVVANVENGFTSRIKNNYSQYITKIAIFLSIPEKYIPIILLILLGIIIAIAYFVYNKYFKNTNSPVLTITKYTEDNKSDNNKDNDDNEDDNDDDLPSEDETEKNESEDN